MAYRSRSRLGVFYAPGFPPAVKWLLISNSAIFVLAYFTGLMGLGAPWDYLALTPTDVLRHLFVWQLATYMFLHGGVWHLVWNMLALWMFGADLEQAWGTKRFLNFYFVCGVGAGICVVLLNYLLPWGNAHSTTVGSSGAIFGILLAYAVLFPNRTILFGFLIPIQVKWFVLIIGAVTFMMSFQPSQGVSTFAHLGGLLVGWLWLKTPRGFSFDLVSPVEHAYKQYRLRRARRKFEVWMRRQDKDLQ